MTTDNTEEPVQPSEHPERNVIETVTPEAVAAIFEEENLEYRIEDKVVRSGFINAAIVIAIDGDHLIFEALWRGEFPRDLAPKVLYACNEHNQSHFAPTLRFFERGEDKLAVSAIRAMRVAEGASFNQLGAFIVSSIDATLRAFEFLKSTFPTVVNWEEPQQ
ncbi:YbjN domain-containing protein [Corynebacterium fournieri]|uniref:YbjN domain-containing protein n=1 Tax=Corynebacterium fournieri TaxID=1852390 RepID=UPI001E59638E|nr:YbjN domain-containing protein [Corynebacterium fournieri]WJY97666.1 hypothetical protein CFOUR_06250 [Corynebacterium fournieri]